MLGRRGLIVLAVVLTLGATSGCLAPGPQASGTAGVTTPTVTPAGMAWVDAISSDAGWLVGSQPRQAGATAPQPLIRLERATGQRTVLCDWADEDLGYCSLAEQGGMIPESPQLLLELVDDNAVRGWFPSGGVFLVDTTRGQRTRLDVDASGVPLRPTWEPPSCGGGCDYDQVPRLQITTDAVSGDGQVAAFCANYESPREPLLYVKELATGQLTRTAVRCGVDRSRRHDPDDGLSDDAASYPQISADGSVVHVSGDRSTGGDYGRIGWQPDSLYFPGTGQARSVPGSGSMTRDGATLFLRSGSQAEVPEAQVRVEYVAYDVASAWVQPIPWLRDLLATPTQPAPVLDTTRRASSDGHLVLGDTVVHDVATGAQTDVASLLREQGLAPTDESGALRISGDGSTIVADIVSGDPLAESSSAVVLVTGWGWAPAARATLSPVREQTALRVDIDPDGAAGPWTFQVQRAGGAGPEGITWQTLGRTYVSTGPANTTTLTLPTGTYRVRVPAQHGYGSYLSAGAWVTAEDGER